MKTLLINKSPVVTAHTAFGVFDRHNREVGMLATTWTVDAIKAPDDATCWHIGHDEGHYFVVCTHATRDGKPYGASQRERYFSTAEERTAYLEKRLADSRKAANKKAAQ